MWRRSGCDRPRRTAQADIAEILMRDFGRYGFAPVPRDDCLKLDTEAQSAEATAREIIDDFGLGARERACTKACSRLLEKS